MSASENPELDELLVSYLESVDAGTPFDRDQFIADHPQYAEALKQYFENAVVLELLIQTEEATANAAHLNQNIEGPSNKTVAIDQTILRGGLDSETFFSHHASALPAVPTVDITIAGQIGRYTIEKCLGQGAMGAVYLARDSQLDRMVALKIPRFTDDPHGELLQRFYREARAAATLRNHNLCPVFDVGEIDGQHYITMAFIEGRPLKDFIRSGIHFTEELVAVTIHKLALALEEAHEIGVIHRDLKPANIMIDKKGEPVVMDFGLARSSKTSHSEDARVTQSGAVLGTPAYMSPEQIAGDQSQIGAQSDIYAMGVIMYELLAGEMPFQGSLLSILQQVAINQPKLLSEQRPGLDPRLEQICSKMMASDLSKRYQSMLDVAADLQDFLRHPTASDSKTPAQTIGLHHELSQDSHRQSVFETRKILSTWPGILTSSLACAAVLMGVVLYLQLGKYHVRIWLEDPTISLSVDGNQLQINDRQDVIRLTATEHTLLVEKEGLAAKTEAFKVTRDGKTSLEVMLIDGQLAVLKNGESLSAPASSTAMDTVAVNSPGSVGKPLKTSESFALKFGKNSRVELPALPVSHERPWTCELWLTLFSIPPDNQSPRPITCGFIDLRTNFEARNPRWTLACNAVGSMPADHVVRTFQADQTIEAGQRYHIAVGWSGTEISWFINGQRQSEHDQFQAIQDANAQFLLGDFPANPDVYEFDGIIERVRISRGLRYSEEFQPANDWTPDADTVALYRFLAGQGDVLRDFSGNGFHGKIMGATWIHVNNVETPASPDDTDSTPEEAKAPAPADTPLDSAQARLSEQDEWNSFTFGWIKDLRPRSRHASVSLTAQLSP
ncbi:protein kinase [bacterium]|nr:protein kinase [bacterium]